jgi:hypothetical protein
MSEHEIGSDLHEGLSSHEWADVERRVDQGLTYDDALREQGVVRAIDPRVLGPAATASVVELEAGINGAPPADTAKPEKAHRPPTIAQAKRNAARYVAQHPYIR